MLRCLPLLSRPLLLLEQLSHQWETILHINGPSEEIITEIIKYWSGIFQGDSFSVFLFILSVNPLPFLLNKLKGYSLGTGNNRINVTHNFFVDDLKLYGSTLDIIKKQLDFATAFSANIGMKFGEDKCTVMRVEKDNIINSDTPLKINNLKIKPIIEGVTYKYLGQDENINYSGPVNKERVSSEYLKRIRKIWKSELSVRNCFAGPALTPTFGILDWTLQDVKDIDIRTRKILNMTSNFNRNSDIDRLYIPRYKIHPNST